MVEEDSFTYKSDSNFGNKTAQSHIDEFNGHWDQNDWGCSRLANMLGYYNEDKPLQTIEERPAQVA